MAPFGAAFAVITVGCVVCFGALGVVVRAALGAGVWGFVAYATISMLTYAALLGAARKTLHLDAFGQIVGPPRQKQAVPADT